MANRIYTAARHGPADIPGDTVRIEIGLDNECGKLVFFDEYDHSLLERSERQGRREGKHDIEISLRRGADEINGELAALESIHHQTPTIIKRTV